MSKWEYRVVEILYSNRYPLVVELDEAGLKGWELVNTVGARPSSGLETVATFIFKRPVRGFRRYRRRVGR